MTPLVSCAILLGDLHERFCSVDPICIVGLRRCRSFVILVSVECDIHLNYPVLGWQKSELRLAFLLQMDSQTAIEYIPLLRFAQLTQAHFGHYSLQTASG